MFMSSQSPNTSGQVHAWQFSDWVVRVMEQASVNAYAPEKKKSVGIIIRSTAYIRPIRWAHNTLFRAVQTTINVHM